MDHWAATFLKNRLVRLQVKIKGRINGADGATVQVDRERGLVSVRPLRERREYTLPIALVADMVVCRVVKNELARRG